MPTYVPRFYLAHFTDPLTPTLHDPSLWVLNLETRKLAQRAPQNLGTKRGLYDGCGILKAGSLSNILRRWRRHREIPAASERIG